MVKVKILGKHANGEDIIQYTLTNSFGIEVKILNYGAIIQAFYLPLETGKRNIVLGFEDYKDYLSEDYIKNCPYFGAIIGRVAGRVKKGELFFDGKTHQLNCNTGKHHINGGDEGFDKKIWKLETLGNSCIDLIYHSPDGEEGYPNDANIKVTYWLQENNDFTIEYEADSEKKIPVNITNHTYFNLGNKETILDHYISFTNRRYLETDSDLNYTGRVLRIAHQNNNGTYKRIGEDMPKNGYDMTLYAKDEDISFHLSNEEENYSFGIQTTSSCLHINTGKHINTKDHKAYSGISLETMDLPYLPLRVNNPKYDKRSPYKSSTTIYFYKEDENGENIFEIPEEHDYTPSDFMRKEENEIEYIL